MKKKTDIKAEPKSYWNFRVLADPYMNKSNNGTINEGVMFRIAEVFYSDGVPNGHGVSTFSAETIDNLLWMTERYTEAISKPVLWGDSRFPLEYKTEEE